MTGNTGPKISSCITFMSSVTFSKIVGAMRRVVLSHVPPWATLAPFATASSISPTIRWKWWSLTMCERCVEVNCVASSSPYISAKRAFIAVMKGSEMDSSTSA